MVNISKKTIQKLESELKKERASIEQTLEKFAKRGVGRKENWEARYPFFDGEAGGAALEKAADETEEYSTRLPLEQNLEVRLRDINLALEKIKKGKYGICEKCGKLIETKRLKANPTARTCLKCKGK